MNGKAIQIAYDEQFEKKCRLAAEVGFRSISVNFNDSPTPTDAFYDAATDRISDILQRCGLQAVQSHLYYYYPLLSADKIEDALEHRVLREIEVSGKIGAPWCVWHPRYYKSGDFATGEYDEELTFHYNHQTVPRYLEQAARFGTGVALENLFGNMIYGGIETLARLCDSFDAENIGICWDTGHANQLEIDQDAAIRFLGDRIKCTHIHNNFKKRGDYHLPPETGDIDWAAVLGAFKAIGYDGPFTLETHCRYPDDEALLRDFARYNFNCLEFLQRVMERA